MGELQGQRDQFVVAGVDVIKDQVFEHAQIVRQQLLVAVERLAVSRIDRRRSIPTSFTPNDASQAIVSGAKAEKCGDHSVGAFTHVRTSTRGGMFAAACSRCALVMSGPLSIAWMTRQRPRNGSRSTAPIAGASRP